MNIDSIVYERSLAMNVSSYNRVVIDPEALKRNYRIIQEKAGAAVTLLAMVKADAYGHDMVKASAVFAEAGCRAFGVAEICEAVRLRESGIKGEILIMMGFVPEHAPLVFSHRLTPVVFSVKTLDLLSRLATERGEKIGIHLKIDTGMGRLGLLPDQVAGFLAHLENLPSVHLAGVVSHFSHSDDPASDKTQKSEAIFDNICKQIGDRCHGPRHIANSGGIFNFPEFCRDMARPGISLYGYYPDAEQGRLRAKGDKLVPAMSFTSQVIQTKSVPAGAGISYGHAYVTTRPTRLAVIPVGYEDGYMRCLSNRAEVLIKGRRAPIRGRVCMNMCMADITGIDDVQAGDEVVLMGVQGNESITADDIAAWAGTISYEVLCLIGSNNERIYKNERL